MSRFMDFGRPIDLRGDFKQHETARKAFRNAESEWLDTPLDRVRKPAQTKVGAFPFILGCALGGPLQFGIYVLIRSLT